VEQWNFWRKHLLLKACLLVVINIGCLVLMDILQPAQSYLYFSYPIICCLLFYAFYRFNFSQRHVFGLPALQVIPFVLYISLQNQPYYGGFMIILALLMFYAYLWFGYFMLWVIKNFKS
jgi:hypothetical protein